ncbi:MAG: Lipolytic enzyme [Rhodocyclaceae bacterium]|nr:Lipolytic enzyme [Rhodocyclaceae bacterium]
MTLILAAPPALAAKTILVFGDSLSAGYGIRPLAAWPSLLQARLAEKRSDYSVANLSISGETTAGGHSRLPAALRQNRPAVVILELGANDGLRGLPLAQMKDNLTAMVDMARKDGARVLLVGMRLPPNYGPYAEQFQAIYAEVATKRKVPLVDFLLAGIADQPALFQADTFHPTAEAQPKLLDQVWPSLLPLLK